MRDSLRILGLLSVCLLLGLVSCEQLTSLPEIQRPGPPADLVASSTTPFSITVAWTMPPELPADALPLFVEVLYSTNPDFPHANEEPQVNTSTLASFAAGTVASVAIESLQPATRYGVAARLRTNSGFVSELSNTVVAVTGGSANPIYVSSSGQPDGDGTPTNPLASINAGISRAMEIGSSLVMVASGDYSETIQMSSGISIYGGFEINSWSGANRTPSRVVGENILDALSPAVLARNILQETTIDGFELRTGPEPAYLGGRYTLYAENSPGLVVSNCEIYGGDGRAGNAGTNGLDGSDGTQHGGCGPGTGGSGASLAACDRQGEAGSGSSGGKGWGATWNGQYWSCSIDHPSGGRGGAGGGSGDPVGDAGNPGQSGVDGSNGPGAVGGGWIPIDQSSVPPSIRGLAIWVGSSAYRGSGGADGSGGGGGGGSAGYCQSVGQKYIFNPGPRGGDGGWGAGGGEGGEYGDGGAGTFAVVVLNGAFTIRDSRIHGGRGGKGGVGGRGGKGGVGQEGHMGGYNQGVQWYGGHGGKGGDGGDGGHGGGGAGGESWCIFVHGSEPPLLDEVTMMPGEGGTGGSSPGYPGREGESGTIAVCADCVVEAN